MIRFIVCTPTYLTDYVNAFGIKLFSELLFEVLKNYRCMEADERRNLYQLWVSKPSSGRLGELQELQICPIGATQHFNQ